MRRRDAKARSKLESPTGTVSTLMSRPRLSESADDGTGSGGTSAALHANSPILFRATGPTSAEDMGASGEAVCRRDRLCEYAPDPGAAVGPTLGAMAGENGAGAWKLCVGDAVSGNEGTLDLVELTITPGGRDAIECGNGKVEYGEQCDDGNTTPGDGCSDLCRFEQPPSSSAQGATSRGGWCSVPATHH